MKHLFTFILFITLFSSAMAGVSITNGLSHIYSGNSGDAIQGEVILVNTSDKSQRVRFELNEAIFSCSSSRVFTEGNPHQRSSSLWFESDLMEKTLAPREKYSYRFTIHIPNDRSLRGSFWTALMVTVERPIREETLRNGIDLNTKVRYAVGLLTNVNEYDEVNLDFAQVDLAKDTLQFQKALNIQIRNEGTFIEGVELVLEVYDIQGRKITEFTTDRNMVFPGVCKNYLLDISNLPPGEYQCLLLADARDEFTGTNLTLRLD